jgi:hypothetical protein
MALVPPPATAIMLKKKGIYGHPEEGRARFKRANECVICFVKCLRVALRWKRGRGR